MAGGTPAGGLEGPWSVWVQGLLGTLGAAPCQNNIDSLWAWTVREKGNNNPMQWNNPLNVGENPGYGGVPVAGNWNTAGVVQFPDVPSSAAGTANRLQTGYPDIVSMLKTCTKSSDWNALAQNELCKWSGGGSLKPGGGGCSTGSGYNLLNAAAGSGPGAGLTGPDQAGSAGGGCAHSFSVFNNTICMDKPLGVLEVVGGVVIALVGIVILGVALTSGAFPGAKEAAGAVLPVGRVVRTGRRLRSARRVARSSTAPSPTQRAPRPTFKPPPSPGEIETTRNRQTILRERVSQARARTRQSRARARRAEGRARPGFVVLGGREIPRTDPLARAALQARRRAS